MPRNEPAPGRSGERPERLPGSVPGEASAMDRPLAAVVRRRPVTCLPTESVESALRIMSTESVGSLIITGSGQEPLGIFTLHDLLNRVALPQLDLATPISAVMSPVRVVLPSGATAYDAALEMVREGVRHVIVVDQGKVTGIVSEKDLFDLQRVSLRQISSEIKAAPDLEALAALAGEVRRLAQSRLGAGVSPEQLTVLISSLNDLVTQRVLELEFAGRDLGGVVCCWLALGSEGRLEQTLSTDQDNGLIFETPAGIAADAARERLLPIARRVNAALATCGFPLCPGEIMAGNPRWCLSAAEWRAEFAHWIESGKPEALLHGSIFFDFRALYGAERLAAELRAWLAQRAAANFRFLHQMAENALRNRPPLGLVRGFQVESQGEHKGTIDLKINGTTIFVDAARIFSLATGGTATSTAQRLRAAAAALEVPPEEVEAWIGAFHHLLALRLRCQQRAQGGIGAGNRVNPAKLDRLERSILKDSLHQAKGIQGRLAADYLA